MSGSWKVTVVTVVSAVLMAVACVGTAEAKVAMNKVAMNKVAMNGVRINGQQVSGGKSNPFIGLDRQAIAR